MIYKSGDVGFLRARKFTKNIRTWNFRTLVSVLIAKFQGFITHTFIIYSYQGMLWVRDMDTLGVAHIPLSDYLDMYSARLVWVWRNDLDYTRHRLDSFNYQCKTTKTKYDYKNLFIYQVVKLIFRKFVGKNTPLKRTCSEDVARSLNILEQTFDKPEESTPTALYYKLIYK